MCIRDRCMTPVFGLCQFGVLIWGSVVVFGNYKEWTDDDKSSDFYCAYTAYMCRFVILIMNRVAVPLSCCCEMLQEKD